MERVLTFPIIVNLAVMLYLVKVIDFSPVSIRKMLQKLFVFNCDGRQLAMAYGYF